MVQKVDTPLPQTTQMPHWFWQVYQRINTDIIDGTFTNLTSSTSGATINFTSTSSSPAQLNYYGSNYLELVTRNASAGVKLYVANATLSTTWSSGGNVTIVAASTGTTFTVNQNTSGAAALFAQASSNEGVIDVTAVSGQRAGIRLGGNATSLGSGSFDIYMSSSSVAQIVNRANTNLQIFTNGAVSLTVGAAGTWFSQPTTTVGSLVAAGTAGAGARSIVTDANATTFASVVAGGGANVVPVYSDGTNWLIG